MVTVAPDYQPPLGAVRLYWGVYGYPRQRGHIVKGTIMRTIVLALAATAVTITACTPTPVAPEQAETACLEAINSGPYRNDVTFSHGPNVRDMGDGESWVIGAGFITPTNGKGGWHLITCTVDSSGEVTKSKADLYDDAEKLNEHFADD